MTTATKLTPTLAAAILGLVLGAVPVRADPHWHGHDMHHFHGYDEHMWHGGRWFHGPHGGRDGWWWIVNGGWYFYPAPVYPYPNPYVPPVVVPAQPAPPASAFWYYCSNPPGYYPYVPSCATNWVAVPATPR
jgi:hypothetical protein